MPGFREDMTGSGSGVNMSTNGSMLMFSPALGGLRGEEVRAESPDRRGRGRGPYRHASATDVLYDKADGGQSTAKASTFNLISTIIGGGVLALPFAISCVGLIPGILLLTFMGALSAYTSFLLVACSRRSGRDTYESVARHCFGPKMEIVVDSAIALIAFMGVVGYYVLLGQLVEPVASQFIQAWSAADSAASAGHRLEVRVFLVVVMLPVTLWKDMHALRFTSFVSIVTMTFLCGVIILRSLETMGGGPSASGHVVLHVRGDVELFRFDAKSFLALPLFASSFMCHFNVLPIHVELRRPTRRRVAAVLGSTMGIATVLYLTVSIFGYVSFGDLLVAEPKLGGNILQMYRSDDPVINAGRCALAFTLLLSVPLLTRPCREASANLCRAVWRCCCRKGGDSSSGGEGPSPSSSGSGKENVYEENSFIYSEASESPATSSEPTATTALLADSGPGGVGGVGGGSGDLDRETEDETCVSMCTSLYSDMSALHVGLSVAIPAAALVVATLVPDIVVVWSVAGASVAVFISFILPSWFYIKLRWHAPIFSCKMFPAWMLAVLSPVVMVVCTVAALQNAISQLSP